MKAMRNISKDPSYPERALKTVIRDYSVLDEYQQKSNIRRERAALLSAAVDHAIQTESCNPSSDEKKAPETDAFLQEKARLTALHVSDRQRDRQHQPFNNIHRIVRHG